MGLATLPPAPSKRTHPCLFVPEIAGLIVQALEETETYHNKPNIARLARTSRVFHEAAVNALWCSQLTVANLIKCMPADCWEEVNAQLSFTRPLTRSDWRRFDYYGQRVRTLTLRDWKHCGLVPRIFRPDITKNVYDSLATYYPSLPILPNVTQLAWSGGETLSCCALFIGPKLRHLKFLSSLHNFFSDSTSELGLVSRLQHLTPPLTSCNFDLIGPVNSDSSFLQALCRLRGLRSVSCGAMMPISVQAYAIFSTLPVLETLRVRINDVPPQEGSLAIPAEDLRPFPSLKELSLTVSSSTGGISVLHRSDFDALESLTVYVGDTSDIDGLLHKVCDRCPVESLRDLNIRGAAIPPDSPQYGSASGSIGSDTLRRLIQYSRMQKLTIITACDLALDNDLIIDMASAWPSLQTLRLVDYDLDIPREQTSAATLMCLRTLAVNCPHLTTLTLPLSVSANDCYSLGHLRYDGPPNNSLVALVFGGRFAGDAARVAAYLSQFFPNVETVYGWPGLPAQGDSWQEVEDYLPAFATVRRQERFAHSNEP